MEYASFIVNIVLSCLSFALAVISLIAIIATVRQNKRLLQQNQQMLEESTRPYISIYIDTITICEQDSYFILKNWGNTPATITKFDYDPQLKESHSRSKLLHEQYDCVQGITLAPKQTKLLYFNSQKYPNTLRTVTFTIGYCSSRKKYEETFVLNIRNFLHIPVKRPDDHIPCGNERQVQTLRELLEKSL